MRKIPMTLYEARRVQEGSASSLQISTPRALRMPIGFAVIVLAVILGAAIGVYWLGYRAGVAAAESGALEARAGLAQTVDPLVVDTSGAGRSAGSQSPPIAPVPRVAISSTAALGPPPTTDPRQVGLNYFIIADGITTDRAAEMVAFCRGAGLDVMSIPSHNARSQVFVLAGYGRDDRAGESVKALEGSIRAVGAKWKALGRGNGDFRDFYPKLFKGST